MLPEPEPGGLPSPVLLLDLDDVLCMNEPFGGRHVHYAAYHPSEVPPDFYRTLFRPGAVAALNALLDDCAPRTVLTSSWLALLQRQHFIDLFTKTGLERIGANLHPAWDAAADLGVSRLVAIDRWLQVNHRGEPYLVIDDPESGASLKGSKHEKGGRVVLCELGQGFHAGYLPAALHALRTPFRPATSDRS